jgi:hypothetical protein
MNKAREAHGRGGGVGIDGVCHRFAPRGGGAGQGVRGSRRRPLYSGAFVLLNLEVKLGREEVREILARVLSSFQSLIPPPVSTHV